MVGKYDDLEEKCRKTVEHFKRELSRVRTGRANASILEGLHADYYGASTPIQQLGMINVPEPRLITIQVYDGSAVEAIEKAIRSSELGLNPGRDGNLIRIAIPPLTEERRKELVKKLHKLTEENRVILRNHRRDAMELLKKQLKEKTISEDDNKRAQEEVQKSTDKSIAELDKLLAVKEKEVLEV